MAVWFRSTYRNFIHTRMKFNVGVLLRVCTFMPYHQTYKRIDWQGGFRQLTDIDIGQKLHCITFSSFEGAREETYWFIGTLGWRILHDLFTEHLIHTSVTYIYRQGGG